MAWRRGGRSILGGGYGRPTDHPLTAPERFLQSQWTWIGPLLVALAVLNEWWLKGEADVADWDWLLVSGAVLFAVLFPLSLALPDRVAECVERLVAGESLMSGESPVTDANAVTRRLHGQARAWAYAGAPLAALLMLIAWVWADRVAQQEGYRLIFPGNIPLVVAEMLGATLAGLYLGRTVGYGRMGSSFSQQRISVKARPGHPDGVAGLRPVGALFLFVGSIFAAIAAYLGIWPLTDAFDSARVESGLEGASSGMTYAPWSGPYAVLLGTVVALSILGFVLPLGWFHRQMREQKKEFLAQADHAAAESLAMRDASLEASDDDLRRSLDVKVQRLSDWYQEVEAMPTWPVDRHIRKRFASNQIAVFAPLAIDALSLSEGWTNFWDKVSTWLSTDGAAAGSVGRLGSAIVGWLTLHLGG